MSFDANCRVELSNGLCLEVREYELVFTELSNELCGDMSMSDSLEFLNDNCNCETFGARE